MLVTIYRIVHIATQRCYVGHSAKIVDRFGSHRLHLRKGIHPTAPLQAAWIEYGPDAFAFERLEVCPAEQRLLREQFYIDTMDAAFNVQKIAAVGGQRGVPRTEESKARMRIIMKGKQNCLGRVGTEQMKQKISAANMGRRNTPEQEARRIASRRSHSPVSQADVEIIQRSTDRGCDIAARYGISQALVSMIRTGKRRAQVLA